MIHNQLYEMLGHLGGNGYLPKEKKKNCYTKEVRNVENLSQKWSVMNDS